jgi:hypothetical protein
MNQIEKLSVKIEQRTSSPHSKKQTEIETAAVSHQGASQIEDQTNINDEAEIQKQRELSARKLKRNRAKTNRIDYFGNQINHLLNKMDELYSVKSPNSKLSMSNSPLKHNLDRDSSPSYALKKIPTEALNVSPFIEKPMDTGTFRGKQQQDIPSQYKATAHTENMTPQAEYEQDIYTLSSLDDEDLKNIPANRLSMSNILS